MGEEVRGSPEAAALNGAASGESGATREGSIGGYLARQRRLRGVSLDELANRTRIPRRSLERLEAGAFDGTPDGFVRGFVRTVAEALGLDPGDAVNRLLHEPREDESAQLAKAAQRRRQRLVRAGLAAAALLAALALGRLGAWLFSGDPENRDPVVYRRDTLRELEGAAAPEPSPPPR